MSPALAEVKRILDAILEEHEVHGFGDFSVKTTPESVTISSGKIWRIKKSVDKTAKPR